MQPPPTRHSPCPCGSGKMYKHCHGKVVPLPSADEDRHEDAVVRAMTFLFERHRKGMQAAYDEQLTELMPANAPDELDPELSRMLAVNLGEWLLAEGDIQVRGQWRNIAEHVLGPDGPHLTRGQQRWLRQLADRPLRLYTVTEVRRGEGMTLVDALDADAAPIAVQERAGSQTAGPGMLLGARLMQVDGHWELSGALYPFSMPRSAAAVDAARGLLADDRIHPEDLAYELGVLIGRLWLADMCGPRAFPAMVDASTGEPILLVTDHYQVRNEAALAAALGACSDVVADGRGGFSRNLTDAAGVTRSLAAINRGKASDRLEVFYRTQRLADEGRAWFDRVAGDAVRHLTRELTDPKGALSKLDEEGPALATPVPLPEGIDPDVLAEAMAQAIRRHYANWADEPIPMLDGKTPRQAIATPAGLERVKGLLRMYAEGEAEQARAHGRPEISYQFLWDALGIAP
jgi:hypothetical protein